MLQHLQDNVALGSTDSASNRPLTSLHPPASINLSSLSSGKSFSGKSVATFAPSSRVSIQIQYGGLGTRYYERLGENLDKILQVDIVNGITESRGSVRGRATKLAVQMQALAITKNDIVMICSSSHADQTVTVLATLFLGAIVAPMDPEFCWGDALAIMGKLKPKMLFTENRSLSRMERILDAVGHMTIIINYDYRSASTYKTFQSLMRGREDSRFKPKFVEDSNEKVAFIFPTQGTTGEPKLVCFSHQNVYLQTLILQDVFGTGLEKIISFFPLAWFLQGIIVCLCFEESITRIIPGTFSERNACKYIQDFQITNCLFGTDFAKKIFQSAAVKDFNLHSLKSVLIGSTNTTRRAIQMLQSSLPAIKFLQCYCLTETGIIAATKYQNYSKSLKRPGSVGSLAYGAKIKIKNSGSNLNVAPTQPGEIYYKGDGLMLGYYKEKNPNAKGLRKGYFATGDLGTFDDDGWLYFSGRQEDIITFATSSFNPSELEEIIMANPEVNDVIVIGNDKDVIAVLKRMEESQLDLQNLFKDLISRCKTVPIPTKIVVIDSYPKTSVGNVKKRVLRDNYLSIKIEYVSSLASIV